MKLTGKCKVDFEAYRLKELRHTECELRGSCCTIWEYLDDSMRYGVYVDFFDSVGIRISIRNIGASYWYVINYPNLLGLKDRHESKYKERPEARTTAIEKANEIYNSIT